MIFVTGKPHYVRDNRDAQTAIIRRKAHGAKCSHALCACPGAYCFWIQDNNTGTWEDVKGIYCSLACADGHNGKIGAVKEGDLTPSGFIAGIKLFTMPRRYTSDEKHFIRRKKDGAFVRSRYMSDIVNRGHSSHRAPSSRFYESIYDRQESE